MLVHHAYPVCEYDTDRNPVIKPAAFLEKCLPEKCVITFFRKELEQTENLYREVTGSEMPKFYRPPQGKFSISNLQQAQMLGYTTVFWSLAYADWDNTKQPTKEFALEKLNSRIHDGAIVLLHLTSKTNAEILEELIKGWKEQGYTFKPLTELKH